MWVLKYPTQSSPKATTLIDLQLNHAQINPNSVDMDDDEYDDIPLL